MDTPRRWQVASLATAVASLGLGGAVLARPVVEEVPSIDLDQVAVHADLTPRPPAPADLTADPIGPLIVLPVQPGGASAAVTPAASTESAEDPEEVSPGSPATTPAAPSPAPPEDSPVSAEGSIASGDSIDSSD